MWEVGEQGVGMEVYDGKRGDLFRLLVFLFLDGYRYLTGKARGIERAFGIPHLSW